MTLIIVEAALFLVAMRLRRRPALLALIAMTLWIAVPDVVVATLPGYLIHPAGWLAIFGLVACSLTSPRGLARVLLATPLISIALAAFLAAGVVIWISFAKPAMFLEQVVGPLSAFVLLKMGIDTDATWRQTSVVWISVVAAGEALLACVQQVEGNLLPFDRYYATFTKWYTPDWNRYCGTLDHPLILGMLLVLATWLVTFVRPSLLRLPLASIYLAGVFATQSRTSLILCGIGLAYFIFASRIHPLVRVMFVAALGVGLVVSWQAIWESNIVLRFSDDAGSSSARSSALDLFTQHLGDYVICGTGIGSATTTIQSWGRDTSFENPFLSYVVDYGLPASIVYFGAQAALVLRAFRAGGRVMSLAATATLIATQSFSSIEAFDACGIMMWVALGLLPISPWAGASERRVIAGNGQELDIPPTAAAEPPAIVRQPTMGAVARLRSRL